MIRPVGLLALLEGLRSCVLCVCSINTLVKIDHSRLGLEGRRRGNKRSKSFQDWGRHGRREGTAKKLFGFHIPIYTCFAKFLWDARLGIVFAKSQAKLVFLKKQVPKGMTA